MHNVGMKKNQKGFSVIEGLLILVIVGLLGFVGWYVYNTKNNTDNTLNNAASTKVATSTSTKKTNTTSKTSQTADPYAGWKSYTLHNEKLSFKYPSSWTLTDKSNSKSNFSNNGSVYGDSVTLAASNSFDIRINAGAYPTIDTSGLGKITTETSTFTGKSALLTFYNNLGPDSSSNLVYMVVLTANSSSGFVSKNVVIPSDSQSATGSIDLQIVFGLTADGAPLNTESLPSVMADHNYKDAKLVFQSFSY